MKKSKKKVKADPDVYQRLVNGLRKHATDPKLSDKEVINQFECVGYDRDESASEKCVCGKQELVWLHYMKNKKKVDEEYALSTFIGGYTFWSFKLSNQSSKFTEIYINYFFKRQRS